MRYWSGFISGATRMGRGAFGIMSFAAIVICILFGFDPDEDRPLIVFSIPFAALTAWTVAACGVTGHVQWISSHIWLWATIAAVAAFLAAGWYLNPILQALVPLLLMVFGTLWLVVASHSGMWQWLPWSLESLAALIMIFVNDVLDDADLLDCDD